MAYLSQCQENLPIFGISKQRSLHDYCTTEKDVARGISRMPLVLSRIYEEDIKFDATPTNRRPVFKTSPSMVQREQLAESERLMANLNEYSRHRNDAQRRSLVMDKEEFNRAMSRSIEGMPELRPLDSEVPQDEAENSRNARTSCLYRRSTVTEVSWDDFELISIIGRGTFGKVYLVSDKRNDKFYAMKCIRKDVVIQHESVESLQVEKLILNQVNHPFIIGMDYVFQKAYRIYFIMQFI